MSPTRAPISCQPVLQYQEKDTHFLPTSAFNHLACPSVDHTSLEPTTKSTVQNTSKASPYRDSNNPEDLLLPPPAISTLESGFIAKDLSSNRRIGRAERYEDHGRQGDYEGTGKTG